METHDDDYDPGYFEDYEYIRAYDHWLYSILLLHNRDCNPEGSWTDYRHVDQNLVCNKCGNVIADRRAKCTLTLGVVGHGGFGQLLSKNLLRWVVRQVRVNDVVQQPQIETGVIWSSLEEVAGCDIVILAVNLNSLDDVLRKISPHLKTGTLVVDVCSVKVRPVELMKSILPMHVEILGTHPLFGPQSAKDGTRGHKIVVCPVKVGDEKMEQMKVLFECLGLKVVESEPESHDREMALVQGLTHFVARAMLECGVKESPLSTLAYQNLVNVLNTLNPGSWDLFETIELGNPFASEIRDRFMDELQKLERRLR